MADLTKLYLTILIFSLISKGYCAWYLNNITIGTVRSGKQVLGKPEWNVKVTNNCPCPLSQIKLTCEGFQSTEHVNSTILVEQGDTCLLINGKPLKASSSVKFSYAWDPPFVLWPASAIFHSC
ncbi:hypothetical protein K2173_017919 [Erythroxylum novogranatense]|uniref:Uncharacterized protein n=1 Tax=Erythroxylum novogranatense TaxID=1862640 RepID=A0AAV8TL12_9ROSI|nr:hypothetical protein K2173_017919 [Erythroxylum novogranatense]